jgi:ATP/maltotriose-dependent transcriptional regulator MalT
MDMAWTHPIDLAPLVNGMEHAVALFIESFALLQQSGTPRGISSGLAGCAALAQERGQFVQAVRLYGAAEALRASAGASLVHTVCAKCERNIAALRARLDQAAFAKAWAEGQAMTREAAVVYALEVAAPTARWTDATIGLAEILSSRELEILRLIADGLSNQEIAGVEIMSLGTIKWYTGQIYSKLHVRGRTQAVARARAMGLLP